MLPDCLELCIYSSFLVKTVEFLKKAKQQKISVDLSDVATFESSLAIFYKVWHKMLQNNFTAICTHRVKGMNVHCSFSFNRQKIKTKQVFNWQMDKEIVAYPFNGILLN